MAAGVGGQGVGPAGDGVPDLLHGVGRQGVGVDGPRADVGGGQNETEGRQGARAARPHVGGGVRTVTGGGGGEQGVVDGLLEDGDLLRRHGVGGGVYHHLGLPHRVPVARRQGQRVVPRVPVGKRGRDVQGCGDASVFADFQIADDGGGDGNPVRVEDGPDHDRAGRRLFRNDQGYLPHAISKRRLRLPAAGAAAGGTSTFRRLG